MSPTITTQLRSMMEQADLLRTKACGTHGLFKQRRQTPSKKSRPGSTVTQKEIDT